MRATMTQTTLIIALFSTLTILSIGCGSLDDPSNPGQSLWTISGKIDSTDGENPSSLRAAFVWQIHMIDGGVATLAQDVPVSPQFPSRFTLNLYELPPESAMMDLAGLDEDFEGIEDVRIAAAKILVYDDVNGNGMLDIVPVDATGFIDRILWSGENYMVMFIEGSNEGVVTFNDIFGTGCAQTDGDECLPDPTNSPVQPGLNLLHWTIDEENLSMRATVLPLDTEIAIELSYDEDVQYFMCEDSISRSGSGMAYRVDVDPAQLPNLAEVDYTCQDGGRTLRWEEDSQEQDGVCGEIRYVTVIYQAMIPPDLPIPQGWPCEITE